MDNGLKYLLFVLSVGTGFLSVPAAAQDARRSSYVSVAYDPVAVSADVKTVDAPPVPVAPYIAPAIIAPPSLDDPNQQPVDFAADSLEHDESGERVTARGNVEMLQAGRTLTADEVQYDLRNDKVIARGNVVLVHPNGDIYTADAFELTDDMKDGFVEKLYAVLEDGSRFWAVKGVRTGGNKIVMDDAIYTPCDPCTKNPDAAPPWRLRAQTMTHDQEEARIEYRDARFEMFGVPVFYTPYFSHPDGTVPQKSGLLTPRFGLDSELGASYAQSYYWGIAPDRDVTIGAQVFTETAPLVTGEYRQRFEKGAIEIAGGITNSDRYDSVAGTLVLIENDWRGHLFTQGVYNINDQWRAGLMSEIVSDDQYARQYNISNHDVLESQLYVERFDDRDYAVARALAFQDTRVSAREREQPTILPEIEASFLGSPNDTLGGRWSLGLSALGLERDGTGQDLTRGTLDAGWQRRDVVPGGLVSTLDLNLRGDAYNVRDRVVAAGQSSENSSVRGFAQANWQTSMPFVKNFEQSGTQMLLEPIVALTTGTNIKVDNDIPNEDSQDIFLDAPKLFEPNRFAGYDRIEDGSRVTYGLRTALYGADGWDAGVFVGQSHRFNKEPALFAAGSGLSERISDIVGSIDVNAQDRLMLNYRFQIDNEDFFVRRQEVSARTKMGPATLETRYFYSAPLGRTDLSDSREQVYAGGSFDINDEWTANAGGHYDFGVDEGWRRASYGLTYNGQCYTLGMEVKRDFTRRVTGNSETEIMLRVGLKNLGEFETSALSISDDDE